MGRVAEGWKLNRDARSGIYSVRFRHAGRRFSVSTGTRDHGEAAAKAPGIYAREVGGLKREQVAAAREESPTLVIGTKWIADVSRSLDAVTVKGYEGYVRNIFVVHFPVLSKVTTKSVTEYMRMRLTRVLRPSVQRELAGLSSFLKWCAEQGHIEAVPTFPKLTQRMTGTPARRVKPAPVELTVDEVSRFLANVPEWAGDEGNRYPARAALDSVCPEKGLIFGSHDFRTIIPKAAKAAGIPPEKAEWITPYDLRHTRIRTWLDAGASLPGVAYQAGHKQITTTNKYVSVRASLDAARATVSASGWANGTGQTEGVMASRKNTGESGRTITTPSGMGDTGTGEKGASPSRSGGQTGAAKGKARRLPVGVAKTTIGLAYLRILSGGNDEFVWLLNDGSLDPEAVAS